MHVSNIWKALKDNGFTLSTYIEKLKSPDDTLEECESLISNAQLIYVQLMLWVSFQWWFSWLVKDLLLKSWNYLNFTSMLHTYWRLIYRGNSTDNTRKCSIYLANNASTSQCQPFTPLNATWGMWLWTDGWQNTGRVWMGSWWHWDGTWDQWQGCSDTQEETSKGMRYCFNQHCKQQGVVEIDMCTHQTNMNARNWLPLLASCFKAQMNPVVTSNQSSAYFSIQQTHPREWWSDLVNKVDGKGYVQFFFVFCFVLFLCHFCNLSGLTL